VVTIVDLDHHAEFGSRAEVEALFDAWLREVPEVVRGWELEAVDFELAVPGDHNRRNAAAALAALELAGGVAGRSCGRARVVRGRRPAFELVGEAAACASTTTTRTTRRSCAPRSRRATASGRRPRARALPAAPVLAHAPFRARARRRAGRRDVVAVTDVYPAAEQPLDGVTGKLVVDALCDARPGFAPGWTPARGRRPFLAATRAARRRRPSRSGAGDVDRRARARSWTRSEARA
jgi:UDP-N-acetylmuramate--alanine ligase